MLNNLIDSWDAAPQYKSEALVDTRILFCGWSWRTSRFVIGFFKYLGDKFVYLQATEKLSRPWRERTPSLIVLGDYRPDYMRALSGILHTRHPGTTRWLSKAIDLQYEPLEALYHLLQDEITPSERPLIGGAPQLVKVYSHSNVLPIAVRTSASEHFVYGRKLAAWEKTEYPVADLTAHPTTFLYPMSAIPVPSAL